MTLPSHVSQVIWRCKYSLSHVLQYKLAGGIPHAQPTSQHVIKWHPTYFHLIIHNTYDIASVHCLMFHNTSDVANIHCLMFYNTKWQVECHILGGRPTCLVHSQGGLLMWFAWQTHRCTHTHTHTTCATYTCSAHIIQTDAQTQRHRDTQTQEILWASIYPGDMTMWQSGIRHISIL